MKIWMDPSGSKDALSALLTVAQDDDSVRSILVIACIGNGWDAASVDPVLKGCTKPVFGALFPNIIHETQTFEHGVIVAGLSCPAEVRRVPDIGDPARDYNQVFDGMFDVDMGTMFVFVDGYAKRISDFIGGLYYNFGLGGHYIGGGAGHIDPNALDMQVRPCILSNGGLEQGGAVLALTPLQSGIGVSHGWSKMSGPYKVTASEKNIIRSLDWQPALEVYRDVVEKAVGRTMTQDNFFDLAKSHPFGVCGMDARIIVRDPFAADDGGNLVIAAEIPQETFVDILSGDHDTLLAAAGEARRKASASAPQAADQKTTLVIDCISRALFLGDRFGEELEAVREEPHPQIGFLSLGEIGASGDDFMEFLNKTIVVASLAE